MSDIEVTRMVDEGCPNDEAAEYVLPVGSLVAKVGGDYRFDGAVVAAFRKLSGVVRYVVEDDRGVLHIYSRKNLRVIG